MRALVINRHDRFNGLDDTEVPSPSPANDEVSIDVQFAGVGLIDALWTTGRMPSRLGRIPGLEVSGTIRELGENVTTLPSTGGFAEVVCAPASLVAEVPDDLTMDLASVVPINTVTAHLALTTAIRFVPGESLLIHSGAGGLGSQFAQVSRALGAGRIDAVVGTDAKREIALGFGYEHSYLRDDLSAIPGDTYDIVIDPVGGEATADAFRVLRSGGRLVRVGNASQAADVAVNSTQHWLQNKTTAGFNVGAWLADRPEKGADSLRWSLDAVARGLIRVDLTETADLADAARLLEALEAGRTTGKVALRVQ